MSRKQYEDLPLSLALFDGVPVGFVLLIAGLATELNGEQIKLIQQRICSFPAIVFFAITIVGMILMSVFAFTLDSTKKRSHWIEQITNAIAQGCLLLGIFSCL